MNIPDKVRIGSIDYSVEFTDNPLIVDHKECMGMINYEMHEIKIKKGIQDRQGEEETLLHEIVHGIVNERNFDFSKNDDETIVEELAKGLHQVIRDNPEIFINVEVLNIKPELEVKEAAIAELVIEKLKKESSRSKSYI